MSFAARFPTLFWDIEPSALDEELHAEYVIERVLEHGTLDAVEALFRRYGASRIVRVICTSRRITRRTASFWKAFLDISEPIACLQTHLMPGPCKRWE